MESENRKIKVSLTEDQPVDENIRGSLQVYIGGLTVPKKVELATKGNKEVRQILSRDPSNMVARALLTSPRLSFNDVVAYATSPLTNDEVLRGIGDNKEYMSNPLLLKAIVANPRTPVPVAMRHLAHLTVSELNLIVKNHNIHAVIRREAKRRSVRSR
jgi:hypothetical protein